MAKDRQQDLGLVEEAGAGGHLIMDEASRALLFSAGFSPEIDNRLKDLGNVLRAIRPHGKVSRVNMYPGDVHTVGRQIHHVGYLPFFEFVDGQQAGFGIAYNSVDAETLNRHYQQSFDGGRAGFALCDVKEFASQTFPNRDAELYFKLDPAITYFEKDSQPAILKLESASEEDISQLLEPRWGTRDYYYGSRRHDSDGRKEKYKRYAGCGLYVGGYDVPMFAFTYPEFHRNRFEMYPESFYFSDKPAEIERVMGGVANLYSKLVK